MENSIIGLNPRQLITLASKILYDKGLNNMFDGNISLRIGDKVLITPSGVPKPFMTPDMIVELDINGKTVSGKLKPSIETRLHLGIYRRDIEARAIVHSHNPLTTVVAEVLRERFPEEVVEKSIEAPLYITSGISIVGKYPPGSRELSEEVLKKYSGVNQVIVLLGHGVVAVSTDLFKALYLVELLEKASLQILAERVLKLTSQIVV